MAEKLWATFRNEASNLLNRAEVVVVTRRNSPLPTTAAEMYALRSLSLMAGVRVVNDAVYKAILLESPSEAFFILTSVGAPYILRCTKSRVNTVRLRCTFPDGR